MKLDNFDLTGKTALITGGAGLLGIEHTLALIQVGARVVLTDISNELLNKAFDRISASIKAEKIIIKKMDVTKLENIQNVQKELTSAGINVDILINNAAIDPKVNDGASLESSRLENLTLEQWNNQISVGLTGSFLCSKVFGRIMAEDLKKGVILNIASDLSIISPDQRLYRKANLSAGNQPVKPVTYSVIKTGLVGLTRYLATYWVEDGVRCNALSPGGVWDGQSEEFVLNLSALIPLGRMARSGEYHSAIQFLCSDASSYMNGQNIVMDGGRSVW